MTAQKRKSQSPSTEGYKPTDRELAVIRKFMDERARRAPRIKASDEGDGRKIRTDHADDAIGYALLMESLGTYDENFLGGLLSQLVNAGSQGAKPDEAGMNFMLSVVRGIQPRDQVEAMLAAQMAAVHMATMTFARRLAHVDNIPQQDSA
jgi:hypothetical protein